MKSPLESTHLSEGPWQAAELIGGINGHHGHGGCGNDPAQCIGPVWEDVVSIVWGSEGHNADHNHILKKRAQRSGTKVGVKIEEKNQQVVS